MEPYPSFRWPNRGRCIDHQKPFILCFHVNDGVNFECQTEGQLTRFRGTEKGGVISLHTEGQTKTLVSATTSKRARSRLFGFIPLPSYQVSTFAIPNSDADLVILETWPNSQFFRGDLPLPCTKTSVKEGYHYDFGRYECLVRRWVSVGNKDTDFSWAEPEAMIPCMITAYYLRLQLFKSD